jgi:thiol-disulfide isomerase/thioredoxin
LPPSQSRFSRSCRASQNRRISPAWGVTQWDNLPEGAEQIDVGDFEGKVIYLFGFQSWCPGCHSHGFPTLKKVRAHYGGNEDVIFVAVQTVFEGFRTNSAEKAKSTVDDFGLSIPVGHDAGRNNTGSVLMRRYRAGGTPWTIIIDRDGVVRFNAFSITSDSAVKLIDRLLAETGGKWAR